jgi:hypothetical protein
VEGSIEGAMAEYRIIFTIANHGRPDVAEKNMERLLEVFSEKSPEAGAVIGANTAEGTLDVTYAVEADGTGEAFELGRPIFVEAVAAVGFIDAEDIVRLEIERVPAEELKEERELQPA